MLGRGEVRLSPGAQTFLTLVAAIGLLVGVVAVGFPSVLLAGKGIVPTPEPMIWVREVGALILALSVIDFVVRAEPDTPTLRALLWGNALVHAGLFPVEILAWRAGVITRFGGIAPNSVLHLVLVFAFAFFARRTRDGLAPQASS